MLRIMVARGDTPCLDLWKKEQIIHSSTKQNLTEENYFAQIRSVHIHVNKPSHHSEIGQFYSYPEQPDSLEIFLE